MKDAKSFRKRLLRALVLPLLLFCMLSALFFGLAVLLLWELDQLGQADRVIARANSAFRSLVERDHALRRYLASGSADLLRAYREADARLGGCFEELARLTSGDPELARLRGQSDRWGRDAGSAIESRSSHPGPDRGAGDSGAVPGTHEIRESLAAFLEAEEDDRERRSDSFLSRCWALLAACCGAAIPLGAILALSFRRSLVTLCGAFEAAMEELESKSSQQELDNLNLLAEVMRYYAIFSLDAEGRIASWNADAERILGFRSDEIVNRRPSCFYSPEDVKRDAFFQDLEWASVEGRMEEERWLVRKDGFRFKARVTLAATRDPSGGLTGYSNVIQEIAAK